MVTDKLRLLSDRRDAAQKRIDALGNEIAAFWDGKSKENITRIRQLHLQAVDDKQEATTLWIAEWKRLGSPI